MEKPKEKSVLEFARGAIMERVDVETERVLANIQDVNTRATAKRTLTLKLEFAPDESRQSVSVKCTASSKLEPLGSISTQIFMVPDGNGEAYWVEATPQIPGQTRIGGAEQDDPPVLRVLKTA